MDTEVETYEISQVVIAELYMAIDVEVIKAVENSLDDGAVETETQMEIL